VEDIQQTIADSFNPVVIRAGRCAYLGRKGTYSPDALFQSRRDPGRALRLGDGHPARGIRVFVSIPS